MRRRIVATLVTAAKVSATRVLARVAHLVTRVTTKFFALR